MEYVNGPMSEKPEESIMPNIFDTDRRIKLGMWGLGRGFHFFKTCKHLNIDVVAGCDYNEHMRENFVSMNPGAFVTSDADEFLAQDFDAVLLATFCPNHGPEAVRCLEAGKHVLSEVTAFHTMAEGVALVEAVEKSGLIYNLAENYPFSAANSWLTRKWQEGLFGELQYGEYEYVHECRNLQYTYIDDVPIQPGHTVHSWRSWLSGHYYCTHSLGPIIIITGLRPVQVVSLPVDKRIAGYIAKESGGGLSIAPELIRMSNGAVIRNLMGATTNDTHSQRLWGTRGSAELEGSRLSLRLGGSGVSPKHPVTPSYDKLGELAAATGHGGGDFWALYYFARQILTGEAAPFDIYTAVDATTPGILALRSASEGGTPYDVPDFRNKAEREPWRNDQWAQERIDPLTQAFGDEVDAASVSDFTQTMSELVLWAPRVRAWIDWRKVEIKSKEWLIPMGQQVVDGYQTIIKIYHRAREIADTHPHTEGARVLREMLELGYETDVLAEDYQAKTEQALTELK